MEWPKTELESLMPRSTALGESLLQHCDQSVYRKQFMRGDKLFLRDSPANNVYYIHEGQVRIFRRNQDGTKWLVDILGPGEWVGMAAMAGLPVNLEMATATQATVVSVVPIAAFQAAITRDTQTGLAFIRMISQRLVESHERTGHFVFDNIRGRLLKTLLRFAATPASQRTDGLVTLRMTHEQLAQAMGVARETVSVTIAQLRHENILNSGRASVVFNPSVLAKSVYQTSAVES